MISRRCADPARSAEPADRIAYDGSNFRSKKNASRICSPNPLRVTEALPMNRFYGLHKEYPTVAGGQGAAPFKSSRTMRRV